MKCRVSSTAPLAFACFCPVRCRKLWRVAAIAMPLMILLIGAAPDNSDAARVTGVLTAHGSSTPLASRDLHFQNVITGDVYLSPTHSDGSFRAILPPGKYRLRTETGAVLMRSIVVDQADINLGHINELAPLTPERLWQSESIAPSRLASPAPSTAYVKTSDTTPLPASAMAVPKPAFDWTRPPPETQASQGPNAVTGMATAPLPSPHASSATMPTVPPGMGTAPYPSSSAAARAPSPMP